MTRESESLLGYGIRLRSYAEGDHRTTCPECSHSRRKKSEPCLAVKIDVKGTVWLCHHCGWSGSAGPTTGGRESLKPGRQPHPSKQLPPNTSLTAEIVDWFSKRGISEPVLRRNGVACDRVYMPGQNRKVDAIVFPYRRNGVTVNCKYRGREKSFSQIRGAQKILFGLDDIAGRDEIILVEGECDKLALEEAGFINAASVPDGAPAKLGAWPKEADDDQKFAYLWNCREEMDAAKKIILAIDSDGPGQALAEELARRLGRERCWRVTWPCQGDVQIKDANEVLVQEGTTVLRECIENADPYPIKSLYEQTEFENDTLNLFRDGPHQSLGTGWKKLDEFMTIREGELTVVTGVPNSGKSEFIDALLINLAREYGWKFALCSFENQPPEHIAKLAEKYAKKPFWLGPTARMTEDELREAMTWLRNHFFYIRADDEAPTIEWIIETARMAVLRYGIRGLVIDPYNEIEHKRPHGMTETEYVSQSLGKVKRFAQSHGVHVWFVAHPAKIRPENRGEVPSLYDIAGSANWVNKADLGVVVHRDFDEKPPVAEIHVRKVRSKSVGKVGMTKLNYDVATGIYSESSRGRKRSA